MFVEKLEEALKTLTAEPNMCFHSRNHLIQLVMFHSGMTMCETSFMDVDEYLGSEGVGALLRDFGGRQ